MFRMAADENLNHSIVRGLQRKRPEADERRVLVTHDAATIPHFAYARVRNGDRMAGVVEVPRRLSPGSVIGDLLVLLEVFSQDDWEGQIIWLPL